MSLPFGIGLWLSARPGNSWMIGGNQGANDGTNYYIGLTTNDFFSFLQNNIRRMEIQPTGAIMFQTSGPAGQSEAKLTNGGAIGNGNVPVLLDYQMAASQSPSSVNMSGMVFAIGSCSDVPATGNEGSWVMNCRWERTNDILSVGPTNFIYQNTSDPGILLDFVVDANQLRLQGTGLVGVELRWSALSLTTYQRIFV
jgi:hypothetical protein